jgi:hypothetical protein
VSGTVFLAGNILFKEQRLADVPALALAARPTLLVSRWKAATVRFTQAALP